MEDRYRCVGKGGEDDGSKTSSRFTIITIASLGCRNNGPPMLIDQLHGVSTELSGHVGSAVLIH